jgi:hypothetical protein
MSRTALVVLLALCAPVRSEAGDSEADELRKARGTSAVLLKKTDTTLFTQLESQARHVDVDALGETLVAPAAGSCMADATVSRAPWCDEFKEADLRKGKQGWVKENGTQLWSMAVSDEHYTLGDYDFRKKQFALKFVPTWCDVPSGMCVTSQLSRLQAGTNALFVLGAYEMGDSRFGSSVAGERCHSFWTSGGTGGLSRAARVSSSPSGQKRRRRSRRTALRSWVPTHQHLG